MSELELQRRRPLQTFVGWTAMALTCILVAFLFAYFAYHRRFVIGVLAAGAVMAPAAVFLVFAHEKARVWWARIMIALLPLGLFFRFGPDEFPITPALVLFMVNFFVIVLDKALGYEAPRKRPTPLKKPLLVWLVVISFSTVVSRFALHGVLELIPLLLSATVYAYIRLYVTDEKEISNLFKAFAVGACYSLGSGFVELFEGVNYTVDLSQKTPAFFKMAGEVFRVDGSFHGPNAYVFFTASCALLFGCLFFYWRDWRWKLFSLVLAASGAVLSIFTYSRGGVLGLAGGVLFLILTLPPPKKRRKLYLVIIPLALAVAVVLTLSVFGPGSPRGGGLIDPQHLKYVEMDSERALQMMDVVSSLSRPIMWYRSLEFWLKSPLWGIGHSNFEGYFNPVMPYGFRLFGFYPRHPHNIFIYTLLSTGLIGLGCLVVIFFKLAVYLVKGIRRRGTFIGNLAIALSSIWILVFIHGLVDVIFVLPMTIPLAGMFFMFLSLSTIVMDEVKERSEPPSEAA